MPEQKKILIAHNFNYDSYTAISISLAKHLVKKGYKVLLLSRAPSYKTPVFHEGVEILGWPNKIERGWKSFWFYFSLHRKFKPDMVISHFGAVTYTMLISWIFKTPFRIAYYHTLSSMIKLDYNKFSYYALKRRSLVYSFATDIIFVSNFGRLDFKFFHPIKRPRFNVVYNGLADRFIKNSEFQDISLNRKEYHFLGRIDRSKGILELVDAFKILYKKNQNIVLKIAGGGNIVKELKEKIEGLDYIIYLGKIPYKNVDTFLQEGYFNIFPSKLDNLPTVVIESLMNGTPVISHNNGGIPEMITDGYNGFLFKNHNANDISSTIERTLNLTEEEYHQMKLNARKKFLENFEMSNYTRNMSEFIERSFLNYKS